VPPGEEGRGRWAWQPASVANKLRYAQIKVPRIGGRGSLLTHFAHLAMQDFSDFVVRLS